MLMKIHARLYCLGNENKKNSVQNLGENSEG